MDKTETVIALDKLERQALPYAEYVVGQYLESMPTTNLAEFTEAQYEKLIETCVLAWKARYETLCELDSDPPF